jgi:hypothetical protein
MAIAGGVNKMAGQISLLGLLLVVCGSVFTAETDIQAQAKLTELWEPVPLVVTPGIDGAPPSDAIVLFDGSTLEEWQAVNGGGAKWLIDGDGALTVAGGARDIRTKREFSDIQLHIEWRTPARVVGDGQGRGNSGVFLMARYELQVLDSYDNPTYANGQAASIYKQHIPLVNAARKPGAWQIYDILFTAPRFASTGRVSQPAIVTVLHNGVLVQNHVSIQGPTSFIGLPVYAPHGKAPIQLQDHGNPVSYRNIWVREL